MKLPSGAQEAQGVPGELGASQMHAQSPATPHRLHDILHTNQRLALWLQKEKEKEQDTLCWESCPKRELC